MEKIKNIGWSGLGLLGIIAVGVVVGLFLRGGAWLFEHYSNLINSINGIVFGLVLLLLIFSLIPKIRAITGSGVVFGTMVWGVLFWFFCLFITYQLWGLIGLLVGVMMFGLGIFATATLALAFAGEWSSVLMVLINLAFIFGVRALGFWIITKQKEKFVEAKIVDGVIENKEGIIEETTTQEFAGERKSKTTVTVIFIISLVVVGGLMMWLSNSQKSSSINETTNEEVQVVGDEFLISEVGKLMTLPMDEIPTVATVSDLEALKDEEFFVNAKIGDKVLIYNNAKQAILYDPIAKKIVNVAPIE